MLNVKALLTKILDKLTRKTGTFTFASGWTAYASGQNGTLYKYGNVVHLRVIAKPTANVTMSTSNITVGTIPADFRPKAELNVLCQGSGTMIFLLTITTTGNVNVSRQRDMASANGSYVTGTSSHWFPLCATWIV